MTRLTHVRRVEVRNYKSYSEYKCSCGNTKVLREDHVKSGRSASCGCARRELHTTHGGSKTPEYRKWISMKTRCKPDYERADIYYDKGISVCTRWLKFENFLADMGNCNGLELDRIDNMKGYSKENCRWATDTIQVRNRDAKPHTSKYTGVWFDVRHGKWMSSIMVNGKRIRIGTFTDERVAAIAWNKEAVKHEGYVLNEVD